MSLTQESVTNVVGDFVRQKCGLNANVGPKTALLRDGLLDSFALIELIGALEQKLGISLPDGALIPEDFETPTVLYNRLMEL
jgi:acyl carrier protein